MRPRFLLLALPVLLAAGLAIPALMPDRPVRHPPHPPVGTAAMPRSPDFGREFGPFEAEPYAGWVDEVMPMHQAVRRAIRRFDGKVLDVALVSPPPDAPGDSPLVYRIRILTPGHDVLEVRMDAFTGRFLDLRGADIAAARRAPDDKDD